MKRTMSPETPASTGAARRRPAFGYLLVSLLAFVLAYPIAGEGFQRSALSEVALVAIFVTGLRAVSRDGKRRLAILLLGIPFVLGGLSLLHLQERWLFICRGVSGSLLLGLLTVLVILEVLRDKPITGDMIIGSICGYLLLGACWSIVYSLLETLSPGSFSLTEQAAGGGVASLRARYSELSYFSYVTLTTLGYGDVAPITPQARTLSWLEAGAGQIYLAVLVARLVGLHIAHSMGRRAS